MLKYIIQKDSFVVHQNLNAHLQNLDTKQHNVNQYN